MKAPILARDRMYGRMRRTGDLYPLDWNIVNTELGAMMEPRQILGADANKIVNLDIEDNSFNRITEVNEDEMVNLFNHSGRQIPVDFS